MRACFAYFACVRECVCECLRACVRACACKRITGTRSSAEVVASAVQDNDGGILVGERSFGKASAQQVIRIG